MLSDRLITVAIHTYERAHRLKSILEREGIAVTLQNVNLTNPSISAGVRVRIKECDLPQALRIIENIEILTQSYPTDADNSLHHGTILVPVDFSDNSLKATLVAFRMASALKSRIHILHSYVGPSFTGQGVMQLSESLTFDSYSDPVEEMEEDKSIAGIAKKSMKEFQEKLHDKIRAGVIPGIPFATETTEGLPEEAVEDYLTAHKTILTVMGTHGADNHNRNILGSVTAEVLDSCRTSVLTVPDSCAWAPAGMPVHTVFFTTPSQEDILALDTLYRLFPDCTLNVTLVALPPSRFSKPQPDDLDRLLKYCRNNYPAFSFKASPLSLANPVEDFEKITSVHEVDLIAVGSRRKNIFSRLFNPTLAHRLLFHADIPLISIPVKG